MKKAMHRIMLSCKKAALLCEKKLHIKLNLKERVQLSMHLSMCSTCQKFQKENATLETLLNRNSTRSLSNNNNLKMDNKSKEEIIRKLNDL